ncbi:MAG: type II toxin-antitoxin system PemK/MazF family toxin [Euzebya sp.]
MASVHDLWLVDFGKPYPGEPASVRPAVVLGPPDSFGPTFPFVIVSPLTTVHRGLSIHVEVEATAQTGLDQVSYIQCELIRSVNTARLIHRLGSIDIERVAMVDRILRTLMNH